MEKYLINNQQKVKKIQFFKDGLDYDNYLAQFQGGNRETLTLRSLIELSRKVKAVGSAISYKRRDSYVPALSVGMRDVEARFRFTAGEPFYERFLEKRKTLIIQEPLENIKAFAGKFSRDDFSYIKGAIFLPTMFRGQEAVLFLGLPTSKDMNMVDLIELLSIF